MALWRCKHKEISTGQVSGYFHNDPQCTSTTENINCFGLNARNDFVSCEKVTGTLVEDAKGKITIQKIAAKKKRPTKKKSTR